MKNLFKSILLVDDREECNYMHKMIINNMGCTEQIQTCVNGKDAIDYLKSLEASGDEKPELVFLDINMPVMDGWEFLEEFDHLAPEFKAEITLVMLSTSMNPKDMDRAEHNPYVKEFMTKFLDEEKMNFLIEKYFSTNR